MDDVYCVYAAVVGAGTGAGTGAGASSFLTSGVASVLTSGVGSVLTSVGTRFLLDDKQIMKGCARRTWFLLLHLGWSWNDCYPLVSYPKTLIYESYLLELGLESRRFLERGRQS